MGSPGKVFGFLLLKVPFPGGVSESFSHDIGQISTWKVFFIIKNISIVKNLTDFRKTVEAGVDPCLPES